MSKAKLYGSQRAYVPNAKADMRFRKKGYQRGREIAERVEQKSRELGKEREKRCGMDDF